MSKKNGYFDKAKYFIALVAALGIVCVLVSELRNPEIAALSSLVDALFQHVGVALLIAAVVGLMLELSEIKEFFESRVMGILSGNEFIDIVNEKQLINLNVCTTRGIGRRRTTNPEYEYEDFAKTIGNEIIEVIGKPYRKDALETIDYVFLTKTETEMLGIKLDSSDVRVVKIVQTSRYQIINPETGVEIPHTFGWEWWVQPLPGLDPKKQFSIEITINGVRENVVIANELTINEKTIDLNFLKTVPVTDSAWIEAKLTTLEWDLRGSFNSAFPELTHKASVHFSSNEPMELDADILGITPRQSDPSIASTSVSMQYPGWLLPGHSYHISWQKKDP